MALLLLLLLWLSSAAPQCAEEDGSTQSVCVWSDGTGAPVLNADRGRYWLVLGGE
ncbi:hypothetical protein [Streptomyces sp. t39]|uniref:hypothetical protein n=1 Tax=Streptomyces sp. t39 TaxID=1828156 RepID=UPI00164F6F3A|nr:hypothetical protein [Streptomyces sp. t39]